jgi:diguanylate cyclase (GGDEF)-like protein
VGIGGNIGSVDALVDRTHCLSEVVGSLMTTASSDVAQNIQVSGNILDRLQALRREFSETLGARVREVRDIWTPVAEHPKAASALASLKRMHEIVHSLAGSAKSFGFPDVSIAAAPLDGLFRLVLESRSVLNKEEIAQIELLIQELEKSARAPGEPISFDDARANGTAQVERGSIHVIIAASPADAKSIELCDELRAFGYACTIAPDLSAVPNALLQGEPAVVFADITRGNQHLSVLRSSSAIARLPLITTSANATFEDRLKAVRLGGGVFIPQPYETQDVVNIVSSVEEVNTQRSYRVVIAEDEQILAQFYQATLEHAGMEVRMVRQPSKLLDTISGFDPDIIIMDVYMSECTGLELAQIVRQFPAYTTVPILFLSTEMRLEMQLLARHLGGDDFLVKPLQPAQLVSAVTSRSNRYRDLKKLTDRDSLTGLLNHTNILRNLEREINVAERTKNPVSFCMVDIDYFKKVNDTYGHVVGDQVLMRITHLLRNRLRRVDYIGRYGGEEFAVVMPNTDAATARNVIDNLRRLCEEIEHEGEGATFKVTFSSGIATYPQFKTTLSITQAADDALYAAKNGGRNRVVVAGG